jgi:hypothetical protein
LDCKISSFFLNSPYKNLYLNNKTLYNDERLGFGIYTPLDTEIYTAEGVCYLE